ncbi:MAG: 4-(cytidine 5'-diphospho)-2-C-methyl-D-erythritol kinase, partial [Pseudomonadales bacterium]|nr:4-(cytidine 5'-diphospho)-2-C-methyl-D-erythritol kinase [Pseudomonadales bacterium]
TPACEVATAAVFSHEHLTRNSSAIKMADFLAGRSRNDCEPITRGLYAEVDTALNWLEKFAPARMTGTGAAVFASFDHEAEARAIFEQRPAGLDGFIAQGLNSLESSSGGD